MSDLLQTLLQKIGKGGLNAQGMGEEMNPYQEGVEKALKKGGEQFTLEALMQGVSPEHIMQQAKILPPQGAFDRGGVEQGQQGEVTGIRQPGWVSRVGQAGLQAQGVSPTGTVEDLLKQLLATSQISGQQTQTALGQQELAGQKPAQKGSMDLLEQEYGYKAQIEALKMATDPNNPQVQGQILVNDINNLVGVYDQLSLKGGVGGKAGAVASVFGFEREKRKEFESASDSLVYSIASSIAGQEGRALSDRDIQLVSSWAKFKIGDRRSDFIGKLNNLIKKAEARGITIPNKEQLLKGKQTQPGTRQVTQEQMQKAKQAGYSDEEINKFLGR